jgi:hypothetical protein
MEKHEKESTSREYYEMIKQKLVEAYPNQACYYPKLIKRYTHYAIDNNDIENASANL